MRSGWQFLLHKPVVRVIVMQGLNAVLAVFRARLFEQTEELRHKEV